MSWLIREGDVLAALEVRRSGWTRDVQGAVVLSSPILLHTFGCPAGLDLAWCARVTTEEGESRLEVRRLVSLPGRRVARPRMAPGAVVAAGPGAFERWHLHVGDRLEVRES